MVCFLFFSEMVLAERSLSETGFSETGGSESFLKMHLLYRICSFLSTVFYMRISHTHAQYPHALSFCITYKSGGAGFCTFCTAGWSLIAIQIRTGTSGWVGGSRTTAKHTCGKPQTADLFRRKRANAVRPTEWYTKRAETERKAPPCEDGGAHPKTGDGAKATGRARQLRVPGNCVCPANRGAAATAGAAAGFFTLPVGMGDQRMSR